MTKQPNIDQDCACLKSHDITFCSGLRCNKETTCNRWLKNHSFYENEKISVAQFADHDGKCDKYWEMA